MAYKNFRQALQDIDLIEKRVTNLSDLLDVISAHTELESVPGAIAIAAEEMADITVFFHNCRNDLTIFSYRYQIQEREQEDEEDTN